MARIIIDAGHGGSEPAGNSSAYGARGATGVVEKEVTLDIAKYVIARLGGAAALTRTGDRNMTLGARAAKGQQADVFVSIHANYGAPELSGPEVYVHPDAGRGSRALAGQIARALERLEARYGGGGERRGAMAVLNPGAIGTRTAACLVEVDYLSNPRGERRLGDPSERAAIGAAIAGAIQQHLTEGQQVDPAGAPLGGSRYGYISEGRRTIRGSAREQIEFLVSTDDQSNRIHLGGEARLIEGAERRLVARLVDMIAPDRGIGNAQYLDLVSGSAVRLPFAWPAQFLGRYAIQLWVESPSPSTRVDLDYTLSLHNYGGSSDGLRAHALDRASPDPFLIPSPSDYAGTGLLNAAAVWASWFADYAAWRAGVPTAAYATFPHNAIAELEITRTDGATEVGTGFYVGPNKLLTNGHVFMSGSNRAASIRVRLGKQPGTPTGGTTFTITNPASHCHPRWASGNEDGFDLGVLRTPGVSPAQFFPLPNVCPADNQNMVVCGYAKFTADPLPVMQQGQYMDGGRITGADTELCYFPIQSLPGGSGSPVFWPSHNGMVVAVFSGPRVVLTPSGAEMHPRENRGVLLTPTKNTWIESM